MKKLEILRKNTMMRKPKANGRVSKIKCRQSTKASAKS